MRVRLRPEPSPAVMADLYPVPHRSDVFPDHESRVYATIGVGKFMLHEALAVTAEPVVADLSCGDARIPRTLSPYPILGDYAPGYPIVGPIESTLLDLPHVDLYVCSETIEHLHDPDAVLAGLRSRCDRLILSTPLGESDPDLNPEHLWGWDRAGVAEMLTDTGWSPVAYTEVSFMPEHYPYTFQVWGCR